jgi:hypothetical protein
MIGGGFQHCFGTNAFNRPQFVEWVKHPYNANVSMHIDGHILSQPNKNKINYAMLSESKTIIPQIYEAVSKNIYFIEDNYELLFTHDTSLLPLSEKIVLINAPASSWIPEQDRRIYEKTKLISMIASTKTICDEHHVRQAVAKKFSNKLDLYGRGRPNELLSKIDGLKDYCFSISMENSTYNNCYTEKIMDCFAVGTIPIYYGPEVVYKHFNPEGIINLRDFDISKISFETYYGKQQAIRENYEIAKDFLLPEDDAFVKFIRGNKDAVL